MSPGRQGKHRDVRQPAAPADFLQVIVEVATTIRDASDGRVDRELQRHIDGYADAVADDGSSVTDALADAKFGTFAAPSPVLGHYHGQHLHTARTLRSEYADGLPEEATETLDELSTLPEQLAIARQTLKTLYMQHELANLSRLLLYVGFPTLLGGGVLILTYETIVGLEPGVGVLMAIVAAAITLVFLPFVVLLVYTFRIATIASRTADFGPFAPRADGPDS